jgi:nicotinamide-nucleotide amidase
MASSSRIIVYYMKACIITIGNELLQGFTTDSNSTWIGNSIRRIGVDIVEKVVIGDNYNQIVESIERVFSKEYDYIFITGGLGPTHDDITKEAIKKISHSSEIFDDEYYKVLTERFKNRGIIIPKSNRTQAITLSNCESIPNEIGTAFGIRYISGNTQIFVMPGVPQEMKLMMENTIIPMYLPKIVVDRYRTFQTVGIPESKIFEILDTFISNNKDKIDIAFLPHHTGVNIRISSSKKEMIEKASIEIRDVLKDTIYSETGQQLPEIVGLDLVKKGMTVSTAESCTGGLIAKLFTDTAGSSTYFHGGFVTYTNELKNQLLDVSEDSLIKYGAVSEEVAREMANGCRRKTNTDIGISATGIAGPGGGTKEKPVGLVYIGISTQYKTIVNKYIFPKNREMNREMTAYTALNLVRMNINGK